MTDQDFNFICVLLKDRSAIALERYSEAVARARHLEYFTSLDPRGGTPFDAHTSTTL